MRLLEEYSSDLINDCCCGNDDDIIIRVEVFIHTDNNTHETLLTEACQLKYFYQVTKRGPLDTTEQTTLNTESTGIWTLKLELGSPAGQLHDSNLIKF